MLGERLKELRSRKDISQQELANILKISRGAYASYEINRREPDFKMACKIADFFNVSMDYLLGREPHTQQQKQKPEEVNPTTLEIAQEIDNMSSINQDMVKSFIKSNQDKNNRVIKPSASTEVRHRRSFD